MTFINTLQTAWKKQDSLVCVGLDSDLSRIPDHLKKEKHPLFAFNREIIDATAGLVCAYKPQIAYYSAVGAEKDLELTIHHIHEHYPGIPVILDAKRGDIGSTAQKYAAEAFDRYQADAVTVNPYLGEDSLRPFLNRKDKGVIILCRTSNPGAGDIQDLETGGKKIFRIIAEKAVNQWNENGNVLLVVGATWPEELGQIRSLAKGMPFLVPGIGAQGGDVEQAVLSGKTQDGTGLIINSSRGVIYAGKGEEFAEASRHAAEALRNEINRYR
ncbi:MAG: orotidine-5'-phosphate decarboxylase [Desulfobacteraceae bacterium]|nr:orotidine-5'-phosphate decarboxylase [Desulfobacteraceae bacterium]MBU4002678.1 orotidine-5'-phosphate decarboxylase [Pseudomonadota bacterium]MBU4055259.1 orotidine-5'-phosphate decarboxylase [Pseudomonadota bacterium]